MTEQEWLGARNPSLMVDSLRAKISSRKVQLAACACCRSIWRLIDDIKARDAVIVAERYADRNASRVELKVCYNEAAHVISAANKAALITTEFPFTLSLMSAVMTSAADAVAIAPAAEEDAYVTESCTQSDFLRDIFGNPFRPISLDPAWLTTDVLALARGIYDERAFDRMPILADALQDAGCDNANVLNHCRGDGPHVRGCWVVDLVLGKA
jgi:hypothetical protein